MFSGDLLGNRALLTPDWLALVDNESGRVFRFRDLNERANRLANYLTVSLGLKKGDRFAILAHNCVEFIDAIYAAGKSGLILVPLGWRLTAHELRYLLQDSTPRALLYDAEAAETVGNLRASSPVEHWLALGQREDERDVPLLDVLAKASSSCPDPVSIDPEDPYAILYTSGTTGQPKGAVIPHRMLIWNGYNTAACWGLRSDDVCPIFTPLYHAGGLSAFLGPLFTVGGRVVLHRSFDPARIWQSIEREGATVALGVPTIYKALMEVPEFAQSDLRSLRWLACGGAPLPEYIIETYQRRGIVFKQGYGMTEVGVNCFAMTVEESYRKAGSVGKPFMFNQVRVLREDDADALAGEIGELHFRGPHVFSGYWQNPIATQEVIDAGGWFHSGDLARVDDEGFFYIVGRSKDMFISGGVNVYPAEIEGALVRHSGVADAAIIGVPDEKWGESGVAFVVVVPGARISAGELDSYLAARLARYKLPKRFIFVDALPRTSYGKVIKAQLRDQFLP